jgi:hypothetical protein
MSKEKKLWTRKEAAGLLGVSENQFHYHLRLGRLGFRARPHIRRCVTAADLAAAARFFGVTLSVEVISQ